MNYQGLESLILSHNLLTTIHTKLFRLLRLFRCNKNTPATNTTKRL